MIELVLLGAGAYMFWKAKNRILKRKPRKGASWAKLWDRAFKYRGGRKSRSARRKIGKVFGES